MLEYLRILIFNEQPAADISKAQVDRIIKSCFGYEKYSMINGLITECETQNEKLNYRVWAAILKLSNSNLDDLKSNINAASTDYRDVLTLAEYPKYSHNPNSNSQYSPTKLVLLMDWTQYAIWIKKQTAIYYLNKLRIK